MRNLLLAVILVFFIPYFIIGFNTDASVFAYMGKLVFDGGIAYIDGWDHKGISMYLINAFGYGVLGLKSFLGIRILELILLLTAFMMFFKSQKKTSSGLILLIAGVFAIFTMRYFFEEGNVTEEYALILSLISALLLLKKKISTWNYALIGAFFIISFTIRANLIAFWIALFLVYVLQLLLKQKTIKEVLLIFLKMAYGAAAVSLALITYLFATESFDTFINAAFVFNFSYSDASSSSGSTLVAIFNVMKRFHLSFILLIGFAVALIRFLKDKNRFLELLLLIWIPVELYLGNISHRVFGHYFLMWVPLMLFSVTIILKEVKERFKFSQWKIILGSGFVFVLCFYVPVYLCLKDYQKAFFPTEKTRAQKVVVHMKENYQDRSLLVWGNASYIYNELEKSSPITFFYQSTLKYNTDEMKERGKELARQVAERKPQLIIDTRRNSYVALDKSNFPKLDPWYISNVKEFLDIIESDYRVKERKFDMVFYELKDE